MAKEIKRFGPYAGGVTIVALILWLSSLAQPDPSVGSAGDPELAWAARESLGFGQYEVLPALAGDGGHREMIRVAGTFAGAHEAELTPLFEKQKEAMAELVRRLTWGEDPAPARQELEDTRDAIADAAQFSLDGRLLGPPRDVVTPGQRT